jgi:hypothetical protein
MTYCEYAAEDVEDLHKWVAQIVDGFDGILAEMQEHDVEQFRVQLSSFNEYLPKLESQLSKTVISCRRLGLKHLSHRRAVEGPVPTTKRKRRFT